MKKVFKILFLAMFFVFALLQFSPAKAEEFFGIGAELAQDTFSKKVIVVNVMDNKPAQRLGVKAGDEIIAVDNEKVKKLTLCDVISKIRGPENSAVKIRIKKNFFVRKTIEITRERIEFNNNCPCEALNLQWAQVADLEYMYPRIMPDEIVKKFSNKYRNTVVLRNKYWLKRKQSFERNYNACMNYSKNNQELCLIHLIDRENATTNTDKTIYKFLQD